MREGDASAHRVAEQAHGRLAEMFEQRLEIVVECAWEQILWMIGISVAAEVEGDHVEARSQPRCDVVPPMRVGSAPVKQDQRGKRGVAPEEGVKVYAAQARGIKPIIG